MPRRVLCLLVVAGCGWEVELFPRVPTPAPDLPIAWGQWVERLEVPECPPAPTLVVSTTEDEVVGGARPWEAWSTSAEAGPSLSLREALWIASNHPGPDTIRFDAMVFPVEAPGTVRLAQLPMPANLADFCLDARGRGVVVEWGPESVGNVGGMWRVGANALMVGLSFATVPYRFQVTGGQVAGCRFRDADPSAPGDAFFSVDATGGTVGPGNVFAGPGGIAVSPAPTPAMVRDNFFGVDPQTGARLLLRRGAMLWSGFAGQVTFRGNTFVGNEVGIEAPFASAGTVLTVEQNDFDSLGRAVAAGTLRGRVGPLNTIRDSGVGIETTSDAMVITRNSIFGGGIAIVSPGPAPTGLFVDAGVGGGCPGLGVVEVFSDVNAQAMDFLGEAPCVQGAFFWSGAPAPGRNVTATFTAQDGGTGVLSAPVFVP